jgi:hypothetical protein
MMQTGTEKAKLQTAIAEALDLISRSGARPGTAVKSATPLNSLLNQCREMHEQARTAQNEPVRLLHHFACTGGTVISKCLAAMPAVVFLSEIDPLSTVWTTIPGQFTPADLIRQLRYGRQQQENDVLVEMFLASLSVLHKATKQRGQRIVLRDHPHSQFCLNLDWATRPTVREMIETQHPVRAVITARHPLASYLSLSHNKWISFAPATLDEYALRYHAFLDRHAETAIILYEDFVKNTEATLKQICQVLDIPYAPGTPTLISALKVSGDSGRSGDVIEARPKRSVPDAIRAEMNNSPAYHRLCAKLGYDPAFT